MAIQGHSLVLNRIAQEIPRVSLFLGPASVGKWSTAEYIRARHKLSPLDVLRVHKLTAESARTIVNFAQSGPVSHSPWRAVIVETTGSTTGVQDTLLKTLEEAHRSIRFFLIHDPAEVLRSTIHSRATAFRFNRLSAEDVSKVLQYRRGVAEPLADRLAEISGGTIQGALNSARFTDEKALVIRAVLAVRTRHPDLLDKVAKDWTDEHTSLLTEWCYECVSDEWNIFAADEADIRDRSFGLKILRALVDDVRPKLVIRSSLMKVLRSK